MKEFGSIDFGNDGKYVAEILDNKRGYFKCKIISVVRYPSQRAECYRCVIITRRPFEKSVIKYVKHYEPCDADFPPYNASVICALKIAMIDAQDKKDMDVYAELDRQKEKLIGIDYFKESEDEDLCKLSC